MVIAENAKDAGQDLKVTLYLFLWQVLLQGVLPLLAIFVFANADASAYAVFNFYTAIGVIGIVILFAGKLIQVTKNKNVPESVSSFGVIVHDPEYSIFGILSPSLAKRLLKPMRLALLTFIVFGGIIIFSANPIATSQSIIGQSAIPDIPFEVRQTGKVILQTTPSGTAETIFMVALGSIAAYLVFWLLRNRNAILRKFLSILALWGTIGVIGTALHTVKYSSSDIAFGTVVQFWWFGGFLVALFASIIPFLVLHLLNNLIASISVAFSSDITGTILIGIYVAVCILYAIYEVRQFRTVPGVS